MKPQQKRVSGSGVVGDSVKPLTSRGRSVRGFEAALGSGDSGSRLNHEGLWENKANEEAEMKREPLSWAAVQEYISCDCLKARVM